MGKTIIIYGSQYGSTKRYAKQLAEKTGITAVDYCDIKNIGEYDRIIYLGALYAGGVLGLKKTQIPTRFYDESHIFHLRGAIDYSRLGLKHRMMMSLLHSKVAKLPENRQNAETQALLATYGKQVDFVDFNSLEPISMNMLN